MPPSWDETFLNLAAEIANRSKDPSQKVGALLVSPDKRQMSGGYNGFPAGIPDVDEVLAKSADLVPPPPSVRMDQPTYRVVLPGTGLCKHDLIVHAEVNAILNCHVRPEGWTLYVTMRPCAICAPVIVGAGVGRIVARNRRGRTELGYDKAEMMFRLAGIQLTIVPEEVPA